MERLVGMSHVNMMIVVMVVEMEMMVMVTLRLQTNVSRIRPLRGGLWYVTC